MVLRKAFQMLKVGQKELQKVILSKGNRKKQEATEAIMEAQSIIWNLILSGLDFKEDNPRQMEFKWGKNK